jgi:hypothetical protein
LLYPYHAWSYRPPSEWRPNDRYMDV